MLLSYYSYNNSQKRMMSRLTKPVKALTQSKLKPVTKHLKKITPKKLSIDAPAEPTQERSKTPTAGNRPRTFSGITGSNTRTPRTNTKNSYNEYIQFC
jgi:hypothetical protein